MYSLRGCEPSAQRVCIRVCLCVGVGRVRYRSAAAGGFQGPLAPRWEQQRAGTPQPSLLNQTGPRGRQGAKGARLAGRLRAGKVLWPGVRSQAGGAARGGRQRTSWPTRCITRCTALRCVDGSRAASSSALDRSLKCPSSALASPASASEARAASCCASRTRLRSATAAEGTAREAVPETQATAAAATKSRCCRNRPMDSKSVGITLMWPIKGTPWALE